MHAQTEPSGWPRRRFYGIAEIAEAVGVDRQLVTVWRRRSSHGLPPPDEELASGPLWAATSIEPWIQVTRSRVRAEAAGQRGVRLTRSLAWQVASRLFHLTALLLEEPRRVEPIARTARDLGSLHAALAGAVGTVEGSKRGLNDVVAVSRLAGQLTGQWAALAPAGTPAGQLAPRPDPGPSPDLPLDQRPDHRLDHRPGHRQGADGEGQIGDQNVLDDLLAVCLRTAPQVPKLLARAERE